MCVVVVKTGGESIDKEELEACFKKNGDGGGYAYVKDKEVFIKKGFFKFDEFYSSYIDTTDNQELPALIHFRLQTKGSIGEANCHPFQVGSGAFAHNGTMRTLETIGDMSDSATLAYVLDAIALKRGEPEWSVSTEGVKFINDWIGVTNKCAIIRPEGTFTIFNKKDWHEDKDGCIYFSNVRHRKFPTTAIQLWDDDEEDYWMGIYGDAVPPMGRSIGGMSVVPKCRGIGCKKLLHSTIDVDTGYCVHCIQQIQEDYGSVFKADEWSKAENTWRHRREL